MLSSEMPSIAGYSTSAASHLPRMISQSRTGDVTSSSMVPVRFSSANSRMVIIGIRNSADHADVRKQRPDHHIRSRSSAWLCPIIGACNARRARKTPRRRKRKTRRSARKTPSRRKRSANGSSCSVPCGRWSRCVHHCSLLRVDGFRPWRRRLVRLRRAVNSRKISSRLRPTACSSFRFQPDSTTARASSAAHGWPSRLSTEGERLPSRCFARQHAADARHCSSRCCTVAGSSVAVARHHFHRHRFGAAQRLVRFSTVSVATSLPLLMMMTRSQVCSTSGRMWVERMMV